MVESVDMPLDCTRTGDEMWFIITHYPPNFRPSYGRVRINLCRRNSRCIACWKTDVSLLECKGHHLQGIFTTRGDYYHKPLHRHLNSHCCESYTCAGQCMCPFCRANAVWDVFGHREYLSALVPLDYHWPFESNATWPTFYFGRRTRKIYTALE